MYSLLFYRLARHYNLFPHAQITKSAILQEGHSQQPFTARKRQKTFPHLTINHRCPQFSSYWPSTGQQHGPASCRPVFFFFLIKTWKSCNKTISNSAGIFLICFEHFSFDEFCLITFHTRSNFLSLQANEMLFSGRKLTAQEACAKGLVSQVFWPGTFTQEVMVRIKELVTCNSVVSFLYLLVFLWLDE